MSENILFYVLFVSQIYLLSYYFPKRIYGRMTYVLQNYSEKEYPRLYPKSYDYSQRSSWMYQLLTNASLVIGIIIFVIIIVWDIQNRGNVSEMIPFVYCMIQMLPQIILEISGFSYLKKMRELNDSKSRNAELKKRKLFNYVSPMLFLISAVFFAGMMIFLVYFNKGSEEFVFDINDSTIITILTIMFTHVFFIAVGYYHLHGKKLDPHQSIQDRDKQIKSILLSILYTSIGISLFIVANTIINNPMYEHFKSALMSLYFQGIAYATLSAMLKNGDVSKMNFDVYRKLS